MSRPLKLRACDAEDLQVVSGFLQDAIVPIGEMCYLPADRRFAMVVSRFRWEACKGDAATAAPRPEGDAGLEDAACYERVHCGICIEGIEAARTRGVDLRDRSQILNLLTIGVEDGGIVMHFSGGACIRLDGPDWTCRIEDLGEPWPTARRPCHLFEEPAAGVARS
ncbi:DUF2948 family protein [Arenibaculum pallidiluteum]|uniref:DUF2948 family protein n=1 Tax=Arenibaculum pallidiluteum TaxID=2812559 RepID=UPI001A9623C0|nr:DUF2948 family protein [Arenibaculum pallidiluteum]